MVRGWRFAVVCALTCLVSTPGIAADTPDRVAPQRQFEFEYSVTLPHLEGKAPATVWMPLPLESDKQKITGLKISTKADHEMVQEPTYGNHFLKVSGQAGALSGQNIDLRFTVTRQRVSGAYADGNGMVPAVFTGANALVPTDGPIAERANAVAPASDDVMVVARALYDDVVTKLSYDKSGEGWGRGDAIYACSVEKGNCTDFHSLFIGMCRSKGIPTRFTIGFPLPKDKASGTIGGYHCWAEFHVAGKGWVPVDASEASKHPEWKEFFFGNLDANRVEFTRGRDVVLPGEPELEPRNYFIYPVLVVDGKEREGLETTFRFADVKKDPKAATR